jgi:hypothetical protein
MRDRESEDTHCLKSLVLGDVLLAERTEELIVAGAVCGVGEIGQEKKDDRFQSRES